MIILCVDFTELSHAQIGGKMLFLGVFMKVFPQKVTIFIGGLSGVYHLSNMDENTSTRQKQTQ